MTYAQPQIPAQRFLVPEDIPRGESLWRRSFVRAATAKALGTMQKVSDDEVLANWPDDRSAPMIARSAVPPMLAADLPGSSVTRLLTLAPQSAAAKLLDMAAVKVDLTGISSFSFPLPSTFTQAVFVQEGFPIGVGQGNFTGQVVGPVRKVALIAALSNELRDASAGAAETVISQLLKTSVGNGLSKKLFSSDAATAAAPAGLLNSVVPLTPTAGGGFNATQGDIRALIAAIDAAGIDTSSVVLVMSPGQAVPLGLISVPGQQVLPKIVTAPGLAAGTIIAVATAGLAVAGDGAPTIEIGKSPALHMSDVPLNIGVAGSPATVAAPSVSMFQTDSYALRCIARICWSAAPGAVQVVNSVTW